MMIALGVNAIQMPAIGMVASLVTVVAQVPDN